MLINITSEKKDTMTHVPFGLHLQTHHFFDFYQVFNFQQVDLLLL